MKKELLIFGSLLCLMSGIGAVRAQTCATPPSCASLGYTMTSSDCSGQPTLVCPFDASAVFCAGTASSGGAGGSTGGGAGSGLIESCNGDCFVAHSTSTDSGYKLIYKAKFVDGVSDANTCGSVCEQNGAETLTLGYREASGLTNLCIGTNKTSGKYYYNGYKSTGWGYYILDCANRSIVSYNFSSDAINAATGCLCARIIG